MLKQGHESVCQLVRTLATRPPPFSFHSTTGAFFLVSEEKNHSALSSSVTVIHATPERFAAPNSYRFAVGASDLHLTPLNLRLRNVGSMVQHAG